MATAEKALCDKLYSLKPLNNLKNMQIMLFDDLRIDEEEFYNLDVSKIEKLSELSIKIGMWISYENITNEYMNSAFIGTMKVYIESK